MKTIIVTLVIFFAFLAAPALAAPALATPKPKKAKGIHSTQKYIFNFKGRPEKKHYC